MDTLSNDNIGYWLFYTQRCVAYAFAEILHQHCKERGKAYIITPPQWGLLALLVRQDGLTVGAISHKRGIDAPTVTGIVRRLEQHGLVERRNAQEDRRMVLVYLTDEGHDIMQHLPEIVEHTYQRIMRGFSEEEQLELIAQFQRIIANISGMGPGVGDRFGLLPENIIFPKDS